MTTVITDPLAKVRLPKAKNMIAPRQREMYEALHAAMLRRDIYGWSIPSKDRWYVFVDRGSYEAYRDAPDQQTADLGCPAYTFAEIQTMVGVRGWTSDRERSANLIPPRGDTGVYRDPPGTAEFYRRDAERWPVVVDPTVRDIYFHPKGLSCAASSNSHPERSLNGKATTKPTPLAVTLTATATPPSSPPARSGTASSLVHPRAVKPRREPEPSPAELAAVVVAEAEAIVTRAHQEDSPARRELPADVVEWLARLVYADKRRYAEAYARSQLLGEPGPEDPGTDWARKARTRFDRLVRA